MFVSDEPALSKLIYDDKISLLGNDIWYLESDAQTKGILDTYLYSEKYVYYDNELIKDNYNLHHNDNSYPSIDHKISIYYGLI